MFYKHERVTCRLHLPRRGKYGKHNCHMFLRFRAIPSVKTLGLFFAKKNINRMTEMRFWRLNIVSAERTDQKYLRDQSTINFRRVDLDVKLVTKKVPRHKRNVWICLLMVMIKTTKQHKKSREVSTYTNDLIFSNLIYFIYYSHTEQRLQTLFVSSRLVEVVFLW